VAPRRRGSLLLVALALLGGCATAPPRQPVGDEARHALDLLDEHRRGFADLRALADVVIQKAGERQSFTGVLLVKGPASMRLEALSPFGQPYFLVVVHEGRLTAYDASKNEAFVGPATAETIAGVLGLPLEPDDLVAVLAGRAAPPKDLRVAELLPADGGGPSLNLIGAIQRQRVWLDLQTGEVRKVELGGGRVAVTITYRRDGDTPLGFDFSAGRQYVTGSVTYRDVVLGAGIDPERFTLSLPKGAKIQTIR
jgi:outer membrane lipoprotein-sorting protein